ncbi:OmpA family protein [Entomobacter blattae]|uniref:OmpA-like domain-containing protein n=1 Tax=Entomobacter blattae TaxID=2762277 RepID=A0A7H1NU17_9PROT|nr:OmpA family protein [Entomobacter blattae]QNT79277.1 hypothetical protein JGUZn3_20730 [Entomobacter blattae]
MVLQRDLGVGRRLLLVFVGAGLMGGCSGGGDESGPVSWWHQQEGGVIAQNRPPPPGINDPYPYVGNTPTTIPPVPSMDYRNSLTQRLIQQRNLQERLNASSSIAEAVAQIKPVAEVSTPASSPSAIAPKAGANKTAPSGAGSSSVSIQPSPASSASGPSSEQKDTSSGAATVVPASGTPGIVFDAADRDNSEEDHAQADEGHEGLKGGKNHGAAEKETEQEIALPDFDPSMAGQDDKGVALAQTSGPLPEVPVIPPAPPRFPNFDIPADSHLPDRALPAYALADPPGQLVRFPVDSDVPVPGQEASMTSFILKNTGYHILVNGYGDARSTAPAVQAQALHVALMRANAVAKILQEKGVPAEYIMVSGFAFGHGVRLVRGG